MLFPTVSAFSAGACYGDGQLTLRLCTHLQVLLQPLGQHQAVLTAQRQLTVSSSPSSQAGSVLQRGRAQVLLAPQSHRHHLGSIEV